jgi:hypothetical protein
LSLLKFWKILEKIKFLSISSNTQERAFATVEILKENTKTCLFIEKGKWEHENAQGIAFTNTLRWTYDDANELIFLEHLRFGADHPVFLFHLQLKGPNHLQSILPHLCDRDCYFCDILFDLEQIHLTWKISGPKKNQILKHCYIPNVGLKICFNPAQNPRYFHF